MASILDVNKKFGIFSQKYPDHHISLYRVDNKNMSTIQFCVDRVCFGRYKLAIMSGW